MDFIKRQLKNSAILAIAAAFFLTGSIALAAWQGTSWILTGQSINSVKLKANFDYLYSLWKRTANDLFYTEGNVGIGTSTPAVKLDVAGSLRLGDDNLTCTSSIKGVLRYNATSNRLELCNGSSWSTIVDTTNPGALGLGSGWKEVDLQVYSKVPNGSTWETIDLSSTIGSASTLVSLEVCSAGTGNPWVAFRPGGEASEWRQWNAFSASANSATPGNGFCGEVVLPTSASGTIELLGENTDTVTVTLRGFIGESASSTASTTIANGWVVSGNDVYTALPGNVGIGVASPSYKLHVAGNIHASSTQLTGSVWSPLYCDENGANCKTILELSSASSTTSSLWSQNGSNIYYSSGNVGVGTSTPLATLHINSSLNDKIRFSGTQAAPHTIFLEGSQGVRFWDDNNGELMRITETGNVGIGTSNPQAKLSVGGTMQIDGGPFDFWFDNTTDTASGVDTTWRMIRNDGTGNFHIYINSNGGTAPTRQSEGYAYHETFSPGSGIYYIKTAGLGAAGSAITWNDAIAIDATNNSYVGIGVTNPSSRLEVAGNIEADAYCDRNGANCSTPLDIYNLVSAGASLWAQGVGDDIYRSLGNVGIGTTSPVEKLDVRGNIFSTGPDFRLWNSSRGGAGTSAGRALVHIGTGTKASSMLYLNYAGDFGSGTRIQGTQTIVDGNLGVGTTAPTEKLHIYDNSADTKTVMIDQDGTGDASMSFRLTGIREWIMGVDNSNNDNFKIAASGALGSGDRLTITPAGNVGIGTNAPAAKLQVVGTVRSQGLNFVDSVTAHMNTDGALYRYAGDPYLTIDNNFYLRDTNGDLSFRFITGDAPDIRMGTNTTSGWNSIWMYSTPATKTLRIHGMGDSSNQLRFGRYGDNYGAWEANPVVFDMDAASNTLFVAGTSRVGIGDSNPTTKLEVAGDVGAVSYCDRAGTNCSTPADIYNVVNGITGDNLGNHIATQNLQMSGFWINGDAGNGGIWMNNSGGVRIDAESSVYDIWIQGGSATSGINRNLAILGYDNDSGDYLYINYAGEYTRGVRIGSSLGINVLPTTGTFNNGKAIALGDNDTGIRQDGDGILEFWTNNLERMHIAANGNVGIGTGAPAYKLDVAGTISFDSINVGRGTVWVENNSNDNVDGAGITLRTSLNPTNGAIFAVRSSGQAPRLWVGQSVTSSGNNHFYVGTGNDGKSTPSIQLLNTGNAYFNGRVGIGTTAPSGGLQLDVQGQVGATGYCDENGANCSTAAQIFTAVNSIGTGLAIDDLTDAQKGTTKQNMFLGFNGFTGTYYNQYNTSVGIGALDNPNTTTSGAAYYNTAMGFYSMTSNTTGGYNSAFGARSMYSNTTGSNNAAFGYNALYANTSGSRNSAMGDGSLANNTSGNNNTAQGMGALSTNSTGSNNTAQGTYALTKNTSGVRNTGLGAYALNLNTTANDNTAVGERAMTSNTTGGFNTAVGASSLYFNTSGIRNATLGFRSLYSNTTASDNSSVGAFALYKNTTGSYNAGLGNYVLYENTTGTRNVALGYMAGRYIADGATANSTGSYNVFLGANTKALASGDQNEIVIGYNATGNGSNSVTLGSSSITKTILRGNVGLGTTAPAYKLDVRGTASVQTLHVRSNLVSTTSDIDLSANAVISTEDNMYFLVDSDNNSTANAIIFGSNAVGSSGMTEYMRILESGNVGIGTTAPTEMLEVAGNVKAVAFLYSSDRRLKKDIHTLNGLGIIRKLRGVSFTWKENDEKSMGLIAQEVEKVAPELVREDPNTGLKSVLYGNLVAPLIEAVKELYAMVLDLKESLAGLLKSDAKQNAEIEALKARLEAQERELRLLKAKLEN